jgi:hypothetical protein
MEPGLAVRLARAQNMESVKMAGLRGALGNLQRSTKGEGIRVASSTGTPELVDLI